MSVAFCRSRLELVRNIKDYSLGVFPDKFLEDTVYLYERWLMVVTYMHDNYEELDSVKFKTFWPKEHLLELKKFVTNRHQELSQEFEKTKTIMFNHTEIEVMKTHFVWFFEVLLGEDMLLEYETEVNEASLVLRQLTETMPPEAPKEPL